MKKIYILIAIAIIGIGSWCTTVNATENIIDLGTIQYSNTSEKVLVVEIDSNISINLIYITSDLDSESLYIDNTWFSPLENKTTYVFATIQLEVDWWFTNDTKMFLYQDNNTNQLYKINIDYSDIEIPPDPVTEIQNKYNLLNIDYYIIYDLYNATLAIYNTTREELQMVELIYNQSKQDFDNNSALVKTLKEELTAKGIEFNETSVLWIDAVTNVSILETYFRNLNNEYNILGKKHDDLAGIYPVYVFFAMLITSMILIVYFKRKKLFGTEEKTDIEIERDTGYSSKASKIDRFTAGITNLIKPKNKEQKTEKTITEPNPNPDSQIEQKQKIDDILLIHKKVDGLKALSMLFQETTVGDIQNIRGRVDVIETKLKIEA